MNNHLSGEVQGVLPTLFNIGDFPVRSYPVFVSLGFLTGIAIYIYKAKQAQLKGESSFLIAVGAFTGSVLGAKLLEFIINIDRIGSINDFMDFLISGRTIIGGLIGGTIGVWLTKRWLKIKARRGNLFAPAIALGVAVGRIGCLLNGCCYGKPTDLPWGINFGDGVYRHPAMLYESAFMIIAFLIMEYSTRRKEPAPGAMFTYLMITYFSFRFLVEFIRIEKHAFWSLSWFQVIAVFVITWLIINDWNLIFNQIKSWKNNLKKMKMTIPD